MVSNDYLELSGDVTVFADREALYIIKASGEAQTLTSISRGGFFRSTNNIEPGDTIVMPIKLDNFSTIRATSEISQIVYQMAIAAAAVNSF